MFKTNDLQRTVTAAVGAVLVSLTFVGAAVGPVRAAAPATQAASTGQGVAA